MAEHNPLKWLIAGAVASLVLGICLLVILGMRDTGDTVPPNPRGPVGRDAGAQPR